MLQSFLREVVCQVCLRCKLTNKQQNPIKYEVFEIPTRSQRYYIQYPVIGM